MEPLAAVQYSGASRPVLATQQSITSELNVHVFLEKNSTELLDPVAMYENSLQQTLAYLPSRSAGVMVRFSALLTLEAPDV